MKIHYKRELFKGYNGLCESVFCAPFEDPEKFKEDKATRHFTQDWLKK